MKFSNPHTHTIYCDGKNTPEELLGRAEELGFVSLGFSSHASQTANNFYGLRDERAYIAAVRALAEKSKRVKIHLGTELDICAWCDRPQYDYILGGIHYLLKDGFVYPVDGKRESIQAGIDHLFGGDAVAAARNYFDSVIALCEKEKPHIMAHFDVFAKNNEDGTLIDIENKRYQEAAFDALDAMKACGVLLEVNTGAMARGYRTTPYPYSFVMKRWKELGGGVMLGSDCHNKDLLNYAFDNAVEFIRANGFKTIFRLGGFGEELFVEESID